MLKLINLTLFLTPILFFPFLNQIFELGKLAVFSVLVLFISFFYFKKKFTFKLHFKVYLIFAYFLIILISTIFSNQFSLSFWGSMERHQGVFTYTILIIFFFFVLSEQYKESEIKKSFTSIIASSTVISLFGLFQYWNFDSFLWNKEDFLGRIFSTLGHPSFLAQFIVICIPIVFYTMQNQKNVKYKIFFLFILILHIWILLLTGSRGAFIALYVSSVLYFLFSFKKYYKLKIITGFFAIILPIFFVSISNFFPNSYIIKNTPLFQRMIINEENNRSFYTRLQLWGQGIKAIEKKFFVGYGPESQMIEMSPYMNKNLIELEATSTRPDRLHNEFLDNMFSFGIVGSFIYLLIFITVFYSSIKYIKNNENKRELIALILTVLCTYFISNQFSFPTITHFIYFWFFLGILISKLSDVKKEIHIPKIFSLLVSIILFFQVINLVEETYANFIFKQANKLISEEKFKEADEKFEEIIKISNYSEYILYYTNNAINTKDTELIKKAFKNLQFIKTKLPNFSDIYLLEGRIFNNLKKFEDANISFKKGNKLAPFDINILSNWGKNLYEENKFKEAIEKYEQMFTLIPNFWEKDSFYIHNQSKIILKNSPTFKLNFLYLARSYYMSGNKEKAIKYLKLCDQNSIDTLTTYGVIYGKNQEYDKALLYYKKALEKDPKNSTIINIVDGLKEIIENNQKNIK